MPKRINKTRFKNSGSAKKTKIRLILSGLIKLGAAGMIKLAASQTVSKNC